MNYLFVSCEASPLNQQSYKGDITKQIAASLLGKLNACTILTMSNHTSCKYLDHAESIFLGDVVFDYKKFPFKLLSYQVGYISYHIVKLDLIHPISSDEEILLFNIVCAKLINDFYKIESLFLIDLSAVFTLLSINEEKLQNLNINVVNLTDTHECNLDLQRISNYFGIHISTLNNLYQIDSHICYALIKKYAKVLFVLYQEEKKYFIEQFGFNNVHVLPVTTDYKNYSPQNNYQLAVTYHYEKFSIAKRLNKVAFQQEYQLNVDQKLLLFICILTSDTHLREDQLNEVVGFFKDNSNCQLVIFDETHDNLSMNLTSNIKILKVNDIPRLAYAASDLFLCFPNKNHFSNKQLIAMRYGSVPIIPDFYYYTENIDIINLNGNLGCKNAFKIDYNNISHDLTEICNFTFNNEIIFHDMQKNNLRFDTSIESLQYALSNAIESGIN